jgi:hypothetical protein
MSIYANLETNSGTVWEYTKFWSSVICGKNSKAKISLTLQLVHKLQLPQSVGRNTAPDWSVHPLVIGLLWPRMIAVCSVCLVCGTKMVHFSMPKLCKWDAGVGVGVNYITALKSHMCKLPSTYRMVCNWYSILISPNECSLYNHHINESNTLKLQSTTFN